MSSLTERAASPLRINGRSALGAVIVMLALFVGTTFATQAICISFWLVAALCGVVGEGLRRRHRRKRAKRLDTGSSNPPTATRSIWRVLWQTSSILAVLIAALLAAFMWRVSDRLNETSSLLVLSVDMIAHYGLMVLCTFWAVWPYRGHVSMMVIGLLCVLATVAGGGVSRSLPAQTAVGLASVVGFVIAAQIVLSQQRRSTPSDLKARANKGGTSGSSDEASTGLRRESWPYSLLALSVMLIMVSVVTHGTAFVLPDVQAGVFAQLRDRFEETDSGLPVATSGYVSGRRLGSVQQTMLADPTGVALRGYCKGAPGYLRGNVFDDYNRRSWRTMRRWVQKDNDGVVVDVYRAKLVNAAGAASVPLQEPSKPFRSRFSLRLKSESAPTMRSEPPPRPALASGSSDAESTFIGAVEIHGEPEKGALVFLPTTTAWIETHGDAIGITPHGLVDRGVDPAQPWVAGVMRRPEQEVLSSEARSLMTWVTPELSDSIAPIAAEICRGTLSPNEKAERIAAFFQNNFEYTLQTESAPRSIDPIVYFLRKRHPAHCELFASASALMLRCQGVAARYVTGYVMDELHDEEEYYLARNRDAHAWVEYYDDREQIWRALEATPGRTYQTLEEEDQFSNLDRGNQFGDKDEFAALGWLRSMWGYLRSLRITDVVSIFSRLFQIPLLIGLVGWLWWRRRHARRDSRAVALAAARRTMDRRLRRRGWVRRQSETLHQFAARIEDSLASMNEIGEGQARRAAELRDAVRWYREHATELYNPATLSRDSG